ncbi:MAG: hypothetical protein JXR78_14910 [Victivallales bacterium]|nr:hypothetical protein [Victivallales bacterium]
MFNKTNHKLSRHCTTILLITSFAASSNLHAGLFDSIKKVTKKALNEVIDDKETEPPNSDTIKYVNGNTFKGITKDGKPYNGVLVDKNGEEIFKGDFKNEQPYQGNGIIKYSNGNTFKGTISEGKPSVGIITDKNGVKVFEGDCNPQNVSSAPRKTNQEQTIQYTNGNTFVGHVFAGKPVKGKITNSQGQIIFEGSFKNEQPYQGNGIINYSDGSLFQGSVLEGNPIKGILTDKDKKKVFEGKFSNGRPYDGTGIIKYANNDVFQGIMINGSPHKGITYNKNGETIFKGEFRYGDPYNGEGILTYSNGERFKGIITKGNASKGVLSDKNNNKIFEGVFKNGKAYDGKGIVRYNNGNIFKGTVVSGNPYKGVITDKNGKKIEDVLTPEEFKLRSKQYMEKYQKALFSKDHEKIRKYEKYLSQEDLSQVTTEVRNKEDEIREKKRNERLIAIQNKIGCKQITPVKIYDILNTYKENEVRGDNIYKSKYIEVTGYVDSIKKDAFGNLFITLGTGSQFEIPQIQAFFDKSQNKVLSRLEKMQEITIVGKVDGLMMNVIMKKCIIE